MNFADRLSLECMMNKSMYAKYQLVQQNTQKTLFQLKKEQYRDEIQNIVWRLLQDKVEKEDKEDKEDEKVEKEDEMILHPKVINYFNDFVGACIENLDDFQGESNKTEKEREKEETCASMFSEDSDEEKYHDDGDHDKRRSF